MVQVTTSVFFPALSLAVQEVHQNTEGSGAMFLKDDISEDAAPWCYEWDCPMKSPGRVRPTVLLDNER